MLKIGSSSTISKGEIYKSNSTSLLMNRLFGNDDDDTKLSKQRDDKENIGGGERALETRKSNGKTFQRVRVETDIVREYGERKKERIFPTA